MSRFFDSDVSDKAVNATALSSFITVSTGTVAVWHRPATAATSAGAVYDNAAIISDTGGYFGIHRANISGGGDKIYAYTQSVTVKSVSAACTIGAWNHWTWRHNGGNLYLFKDGVSQGSVACGDTDNVTGTIQMGTNYTAAAFMEGDIANLAIWNVALTDAEILAHAKGVPAPYVRGPANLTGNWPFWGIHSPEIDLTSNRRLLTLTGTIRSDGAPVPPFSRRFWQMVSVDTVASGPTFILYNKGAAGILDHSINLTTSTLKVMLVTSAYTPDADHDFASTPASAEISVSGYSRQTLSGRVFAEDDTNDRATMDATDITFSALTAGQTVAGAILFDDAGGADSARVLIAYYALTPYATAGVGLQLTIDTTGLLRM